MSRARSMLPRLVVLLLVVTAINVLVMNVVYGRPIGNPRDGSDAGSTDLREPDASWPLPGRGLDREIIPLDIALDGNGRVYVADGKNQAVLVYDSAGQIVGQWDNPPAWRPGLRTPCSGYFVPHALAIGDASDRVYVLWSFYRLLNPDGGAAERGGGIVLEARRPDGSVEASYWSNGSAVDFDVHEASKRFYLPGSGGVDWYDTSMFGHNLRHILIQQDRETAGTLAMTPDERIILAKQNTGTVFLYSVDGRTLGSLDLDGRRARAVDVDRDGAIYVLVTSANAAPTDVALMVFEPSGKRLRRTWTAQDLGLAMAVPTGSWPFTLTVRDRKVVFTSAASRFSVHMADLDALPARTVVEGDDRAESFTPDGIFETPCEPYVMSSHMVDGQLYVVDGLSRAVMRFAADGTSVILGHVPDAVRDIVVVGDVDLVISTSTDRLMYLDGPDFSQVRWEVPCDCQFGGQLAVMGDRLLVSRPADTAVSVHRLGDGSDAGKLQYGDDGSLWPSDLGTDAQGRLLATNASTGEVSFWADFDRPATSWQAGFFTGASALATGRFRGTESVALAMVDGSIGVYRLADGDLRAYWLPGYLGVPVPVSDLALDSAGRVLVTDPVQRRVHVFDLSDANPPELPPTVPTPARWTCAVTGDKQAGPKRVVLGATAAITLTLAATCPDALGNIDLMLVLDHSGSINGPGFVETKDAARRFVQMVDVRRHRIGLVWFEGPSRLAVPLTTNAAQVLKAIDEQPGGGGGTDIAGALLRARDELVGNAWPALPVVVLVTDGQHTNQISGISPAEAARQLRDQGIQVYAIGIGGAQDENTLYAIAGRGRYFSNGSTGNVVAIWQQVLRWSSTSLTGNVLLHDRMAADIDYVPGSSSPSAWEEPNTLRWGRSMLPRSGITLTYRIRPQRLGQLPTNDFAVADYTDADGVQRRFTFPVPQIEVVAPTPTTVPTTATPRARLLYLPVVQRELQAPAEPIFLPMILRERCTPTQQRVDVTLVVDASTSMGEMTASGNTKLAAAQQAVNVFLGELGLARGDQAALVTFNSAARLLQPLTSDRVALSAALGRIQTQPQTCVACGLEVAIAELASDRASRGNAPVIILLTDGRSNPRPISEAVSLAAKARAAGVTIFAIGLGDDVDSAALAQIAGRPDQYHVAPSAEDLAAIYRSIAVLLPCPGAEFWGGRPPAAVKPSSRLWPSAAGPEVPYVLLPVVSFQNNAEICQSWLAVQNVGRTPSKAIVVAWPAKSTCGETCVAPVGVVCSGLISPGAAWHFLGAQLPQGAASAIAFSFNLARMRDAGASDGSLELAVDHLCATLAAQPRSCATAAELLAAAASGGMFAGVNLSRVVGSPLTVDVLRKCPADQSPGGNVVAGYGGLASNTIFAHADGASGYEAYAAPVTELAETQTLLYVQNGGSACAAIGLWFKRAGDCGPDVLCKTMSMAPGSAARLRAKDCVGAEWQGSLRVASDQPIAVVAEVFGGDVSTTHTGAPPRLESDAAGWPVLDTAGTVAYAPLVYDRRSGWDTTLTVQNLSHVNAGRARVTFQDDHGAVLDTQEGDLCAGGSRSFDLPATGFAPDSGAASARVESLAVGGSAAVPISAVARMAHGTAADPVKKSAAVAYELIPDALGYAWPAGGAGIGVVAIPQFVGDRKWTRLTSELAIQNLVPVEGHTDVAVLLFDENALVATSCRSLAAQEVAYIDLWHPLASVSPGFLGSAVVSATAWHHPVPGTGANAVGLAAVIATRSETDRSTDIPGDELALTAGVPLRKAPVMSSVLSGQCPTVPPPPPPNGGPGVGATTGVVYLPAMTYLGNKDGCQTVVEVRNGDSQPAKALLVTYGQAGFCPPGCAGPHLIACSGLLAPGATWRFTSGQPLGSEGAGVVFGFNTKTLAELGVSGGRDMLAADWLCLKDDLVGLCDTGVQLRLAYLSGGTFLGIPMERAFAAPISAIVERECPNVEPAGPRNSSRYDAPSGAHFDLEQSAERGFWQSAALILGNRERGNSMVYLQNAGLSCATIRLTFRPLGDCTGGQTCSVFTLAPDESYAFKVSNCVGPSFQGTVVIRSSEPLAVVGETVAPGVQRTWASYPSWSPYDLDDDLQVTTADVDMVTRALGATPTSPNWNPRADLDHDLVITVGDRDLLQQGGFCSGAATPSPTVPTSTPPPIPTDSPTGHAVYLPFSLVSRR